jgi:hypothetical protein
MMFTLEAVKAKHGDSLLLRYGKPGAPNLIVIDGGPSGVYGTAMAPGPLRQRLLALREARSKATPLPIKLLMVSHIDDDHIGGVLELTRELTDLDKEGKALPFQIQGLWHNSFNDILGDEADELFKAVGGAARAVAVDQAPPTDGLPKHEAMVVASVPQGRQLRNDASALAIPINRTKPLKGLVCAPDDEAMKVNMGDGLTLTVLGPMLGQLEKLRKTWDTEIKRLQKEGKLDETHAAAFGDDRSVYNLSSIIVLAEGDGKTMLLTGDALCTHILDGLESAGKLKKGGALHVDLLKLPHHGSMRNINEEFFERVTADHYVISANGRDDNPYLPTLETLIAVRKKVKAKPATLHLTTLPDEQHPKKTAIAEAIAFLKAHGPEGELELDLRAKDKLSVEVDLSSAK